MIFESLWPLTLLLAVPVVIILYLLKPKGKDYKISSNILWENLFRNQQSKTFLEKFIHNLLMYLQILLILLLVLAFMSPYIRRQGTGSGNIVLVLDTSGSMQHDAGNGKLRIEEAVDQAKNLIAASEGSAFSIVTNDCLGTELLAVGVKDKNALNAALDGITCSDGPGRMQDAESIVETLCGAGEEADGLSSGAEVIVYTDGIGAGDAAGLSGYLDAQIVVVGDAVNNVSNNFLSYVEEEEEVITCAVSLTNYGDAEASMEVSLYEDDRLLAIRQMTLAAGETTLCFFPETVWNGGPLRSEIGSIRFAGSSLTDSLSEDNVSYAVPNRETSVEAVLIGSGNTYLEKAYRAATGKDLDKVENEAMLQDMEQTVRIYDAGVPCEERDGFSSIRFYDDENAIDTVERTMLTVTSCDLTSGIFSFSIGVNKTYVYEVPEWGTGFLWAGEQCAGYYGEYHGVKTVVAGFDIRESDFPLKAEFPIFISNAVHFLGDTSLLAEMVYEAGETVLFHPQSDFDVNTLMADTRKAGLYDVTTGDILEQYVVRFAAGSQSDGQRTAEGTVSDASHNNRLMKKQLRNGLLVLAFLLMIVEWLLYVRQMRYRGRFYLVVRAIGMTALFLALLGISVSKRDSVNTTIFLVDISNSNEQNLSAMESYLKKTVADMPRNHQYGIVTFGKNSLVEQFLVREDHVTQIMSLPDKTATNFEDAVSRALAMLPAGGAGQIVILTDAKETKGSLVNTASALMSRETGLLAMIYETSQGPDAYVDGVELPSYLYQGDAYSITVTVESNYETDAQIQIWMETMLTDTYAVHLNRGTNRFRFQQKVTGESVESFEVRVIAKGDTCAENNSYHAYSVVDSVPKVLLVSGMQEDSGPFEKVLLSAGCNFSTVSAINAPDSLEELLAYKSILLENVYLSDLPAGFLENIETYVKDYGCGLICMGGDESYALGGYRESVLETVLPVDMELRGVDEIPSMAMIMVIDHSGSMSADAGNGATNLDLAITAAENAVDQMRSTDYVGVISFDNNFEWVVEPTIASDKEAIKKKIETIAEGGGTTIMPSLRGALSGVTDCDVGIRHVVLLTDGQGESRNFNSITTAYKNADVTLSTVAVGSDSDTWLLEQIAKDCGGRYYYSDMASDIPKIFAQEVFLSGDTYLQNGEFGLAVNGNNEITRDLFTSGWPKIYGYVSATSKPASNMLIASEKDDPVLTIMQYGLGHTVAWNTDVTNEWTAGFAGADDYVQLWKHLVDYSVGIAAIGEDSVDVMTAGGYTTIVYDALDYGEQTKVEAVYTDPEGNTSIEPLHATAPGRYEAKLDTDMTGIYNLSVRRADGGAITNAVTTAAVVQYSDEYKFDAGTAAFTNFVSRYGAIIEPGENIWNQRQGKAKERYDLTNWLLLFTVLWFVMDIAFRRFHFLPQDTGLYRRIRRRHMEKKHGKEQGHETENAFNITVADMAVPAEISLESAPGKEDSPGVDDRGPADRRGGQQTKARPKNRERTGKKQEPQALDTSSLLRKKEQRNQ